MPASADFFELYDMPRTLHPEQGAVRKAYYALSRRFHPDMTSAGGDAADAQEVLRMAALNNEARATFADPDRLLAYVLKLHGVLEDEEQYRLPQDFLMDMMDLNEAVDEGGADAKAQWQAALQEWEAGAAPWMNRYDAGEHNGDVLAALKDAYFRKKYLMRLGERLAV